MSDELTLERLAGFDAAREEWAALAGRSDNVFATWEWAMAWWKHLGRDRPLHLVSCRRPNGDPVAILPFFLASDRPLRVMRLIGHGPGDELGPVCAPADRAAVAPLFRRALDLYPRAWDMLVADNLPADGAWTGIGRAAAINEMPDPVIETDGVGWEDYLASRSSKFRRQFRGDERRLQRDHGLSYRLAEDADRLDEDLDMLFALHEMRWGEESSGVFAAEQAAMQREFAHTAFARGWLRLWLMELE